MRSFRRDLLVSLATAAGVGFVMGIRWHGRLLTLVRNEGLTAGRTKLFGIEDDLVGNSISPLGTRRSRGERRGRAMPNQVG
jgi:hypothetical protein